MGKMTAVTEVMNKKSITSEPRALRRTLDVMIPCSVLINSFGAEVRVADRVRMKTAVTGAMNILKCASSGIVLTASGNARTVYTLLNF